MNAEEIIAAKRDDIAFEILGEALVRVRDLEAPIFERIDERDRAIGLRNLIIHRYDRVGQPTRWEIATAQLPRLRTLPHELLDEAERQGL